jgi:hypothetical protein
MTSKKVTAFAALYLRQYLSNDFDINGTLSQDIQDRLCRNSLYVTFRKYFKKGC